MEFSFWFDTINLGWSIVYVNGMGYDFKIKVVNHSLKFVFILSNTVGTGVMPHYVAFRLGLLCLPKYANIFKPASTPLIFSGMIAKLERTQPHILCEQTMK